MTDAEQRAVVQALTALNSAEAWMLEARDSCEAENASSFLPRGYNAGIREVRRAIARLRDLTDK